MPPSAPVRSQPRFSGLRKCGRAIAKGWRWVVRVAPNFAPFVGTILTAVGTFWAEQNLPVAFSDQGEPEDAFASVGGIAVGVVGVWITILATRAIYRGRTTTRW